MRQSSERSTAMKIGISTFVTGYSIHPAVLAQRVEALGFESFWVPEHPIIPVRTTTPFPGSADGIIPDHYSKWLDPFATLATAAAVMSKRRRKRRWWT